MRGAVKRGVFLASAETLQAVLWLILTHHLTGRSTCLLSLLKEEDSEFLHLDAKIIMSVQTVLILLLNEIIQ